MFRKVFVVFLLFLFPYSVFGNYTGQAPYKLLFIHHPSADFDVNMDIFNPKKEQLEREEIEKVITASLIKSIIPLQGILSGNLIGSEQGLFSHLFHAISIFSNDLQKEIRRRDMKSKKIFPVIQDIFLIPWIQKERDLFYNAEKISMKSHDMINILGITPASESFDETVTRQLKELQQKLYKKSNDPIFLMGYRTYVWINMADVIITCRVLLGLNPTEKKLSIENDRVYIDKLIIPDVEKRGGVAALTFEFNFSENKTKPAMLTAEFGDLDRFSNGEFVIKDQGKKGVAPRLEGTRRKGGIQAVSFTFSKFDFDIPTHQVVRLEELVSAGLRIGNKNYVLGEFHVESVDKEFKDEINRTIRDQLDNIFSKIIGGVLK